MLNRSLSLQGLQLIILFVICPILSFPFLLYYASQGKRWAYTLLAIFMGLCAILWPPTGDLYRHNMMYFDFREMDMAQFFEFIKVKFDFLLYAISFLFAKAGVPFEFIRFFFVFITYKLVFLILEDCSGRNSQIDRSKSIVFFVFFFSVLFFTIVQGLRFGFAAILIAFGSYQYLVRKKLNGLLYIVISCVTHFSVIPVALFLAIAKLGIKIKRFWVIVLSAVCLLCLNPIVFQMIIDVLPLDATLHAVSSAYITGYWGGEFLEDHSLKYQISKYLSHLMMYPLLYFTIKNDSIQPFGQFAKFLVVIVCACFAISDTLYFRMAILFIIIGLALFFMGEKQYSRVKIYILLLCSSISFFSQIYTFRREATISREYMLFCPAPLGFSSTFSKQWIEQHVYEDGEGKALY